VILWLRVESEPVRLYYSNPAALALLDAGTAKHATLVSLGSLREDTEGETANVSVTIGPDSIRHFDDPPIGARAIVQSDAGDVFTGTIHSVSVAAAGTTLGLQQ
jgi:hypothetical protein